MTRAILVKSCQRFRRRWDAVEVTWGNTLRSHGVSVYCVIANGRENAIGNMASITHPIFGQWISTKTGDDYSSNSEKLREAIRMALTTKFTRLFITDDDTFVHPQRWLAHEPQGELECRVFHPKSDADKKRNHGQPWVHGGAGWWMSRRLCELYVAECKERTSADDILVARIAAKHGIEMVDRPDLYASDRYSGKEERVAADNQLITCHHVQPAEMVELWEATK